MADTQVVELRGRHWLIGELLRIGLEVALPVRDRGVDLIVYTERRADVDRFSARPVQLKAASLASFSITRKYDAFAEGLLIAYVWYLDEPQRTTCYATSYAESLQIGETLGWTAERSWTEKGYFTTTKPSRQIVSLLEPYAMTPEKWWAVLRPVAQTPMS